MIHQDAIEQAVERQLEIERKAAAWDLLAVQLRDQGNQDALALLQWMARAEGFAQGARRG